MLHFFLTAAQRNVCDVNAPCNFLLFHWVLFLFSSLSSSLSYAFPGVVTVTSLQRGTQRFWIGGLLESSAISASVLLLAVLPVSVALLSAGSGSPGLHHCVLAGDPTSTHASPLRSASPVRGCKCEWIVGHCWHHSVLDLCERHASWLKECFKAFHSCVCCREIPAAGDPRFLKMTHCWNFTMMTPGPPTTCSREASRSQVMTLDSFTTYFTELYPEFYCEIKTDIQ